ncbi:MAG: cupredoxin domain-containing protein [Candidatus Limnocylindrales bacterium]
MAVVALGLALFTATALSRPAMGASGDARVAVEGFAFTPPTITIPAGASVVWAVRKDPEQHTVTPTTPGSFDGSGPLFDGDDYTVRFDTPGRYGYVCSFHPFMTGSVVVEPAETAMPIATASPTATTAPILTPSGSVPSVRPSDPAGDRTPGPPTFAVVLILVALVGAVGAALLLRGRHAR